MVVLGLCYFLLLVTEVCVVSHDLLSVESVSSCTEQVSINFGKFPRRIHSHASAHASFKVKSLVKLVVL